MQDLTLERWKSRFARAAALLGERLDDPPALEELASAAAISPYHFHRLWRALTGETVSESVLRLRLEASQQMLTGSESTVTEIAMATGFGTPQSFARAFRRHTGITPSAFRQSSGQATPPIAPAVEIIERGRTLVVALRHDGEYRDLNGTFAAIFQWAQEAGILERLRGLYGIPFDDPDSVAAENLRYDACLALGDATPPAPFRPLHLPAGPTARLRHIGSYDGLQDATQTLVAGWLLNSGREPADHPVYYQYLNDPDETPEQDLLTDILLPLAP